MERGRREGNGEEGRQGGGRGCEEVDQGDGIDM